MAAEFAIKLLSHDGTRFATGIIPFAPVPGIFLKAPWEHNDYLRVGEVFYDHHAECFEVYLEKAED